jgi:hypothetical protein
MNSCCCCCCIRGAARVRRSPSVDIRIGASKTESLVRVKGGGRCGGLRNDRCCWICARFVGSSSNDGNAGTTGATRGVAIAVAVAVAGSGILVLMGVGAGVGFGPGPVLGVWLRVWVGAGFGIVFGGWRRRRTAIISRDTKRLNHAIFLLTGCCKKPFQVLKPALFI